MIDVRQTTSKLIRAFSNRENQLKLKAYEQRSTDFNAFNESFENLKELYRNKLNTPLEDVNSIKDNLKLLKEKTETLTDLRNSKKDQYDKYVEECNKSKELRSITMKILSQQVGTEKVDCETQIADAKEKGMKDEEELQKSHKETCELLEKKMKALTSDVEKVKTENEKEEAELRKKFKAISSAYQNNMQEYDRDVQTQTVDNQKFQAEYDEIYADLQQTKEEYAMRLEEKRKRTEIEEFMARKDQEQKSQMQKLERASEFIQAHWRGLLARKDMEKARKGKKKKKKK